MQIFDEIPTPSSESSNFCKPRKQLPSALVSKIMEMGFPRKSIDLAIKSIGKNLFAIIDLVYLLATTRI